MIDALGKLNATNVTHSGHATNAREKAITAARSDQLDLSDAAQRLLDREEAPIRGALVSHVRTQIEAGDYLSDDKLDVVVDRLFHALRNERKA